MKKVPATKKQIKVARSIYQTDDIEIDDDALQSQALDEDGAWISAWVWISETDLKTY